MKSSHLVCAIVGGIILAYLAIVGGQWMLNTIAEGNVNQACAQEAHDANYTEETTLYPVTETFAHALACRDGYSYKRLPESIKQEYRQLVWDAA